MTSYLEESVEFQVITVEVNGQSVVSGITLSITQDDERPGSFDTTPMVLADKVGFLVQGYAKGTWYVYARVEGYAPEVPVMRLGSFRVE